MGKTRSNDVIKPQDLEVKNLIADDLNLKAGNIYNDEIISINSPEVSIQEDKILTLGNDIFLGWTSGIVSLVGGLRIFNVGSLADHVRTKPLAIGTMIFSLENSKPLWLAEMGEKSLTSITISSVSGVSGDVSVILESETITFTMTEGDTIADFVQKMTTAINAGTYYTAQVIESTVKVESKDYAMETILPTLTCDVGVVVDANISLDTAGKPYIFVDGAGTQLEVN